MIGRFALPGPSATQGGGLRYAVVHDSHLTEFRPAYTANTKRVYDHLAARTPLPDFILHVGDIVDTGFPEEWDLYESLVPDDLRDRFFYTSGNHEVRWDENGNREFLTRVDPPPYSFDAGPIHLVGLDAAVLLQETGLFGAAQLEWLRADLDAAGPEQPVVIFFHYPVGARNYYIIDQDVFFRTIEPYNVVGIHVGHVHRDEVLRLNGFVQVSGAALRNGPTFHWVEVGDDVLAVSTASVAASGEATLRRYVDIPLARDPARPSELPPTGVGRDRWPGIQVSVDGTAVEGEDRVETRFWPYPLYATQDSTQLGWHDLEPDGGWWTDALPTGNIPPGDHRIEVRLSAEGAPLWQFGEPATVASERGEIAKSWEVDLGAAIQAGVTAILRSRAGRPLVIVATSSGRVVALDVRGRPRVAWQRELGSPVIGSPAVTDQGTIALGTRDGLLIALDTATGSPVWENPIGEPIMGSLEYSNIDGVTTLLVPVRSALFAVEPETGDVRWTGQTGGFIGGRPSADAAWAYASAGDGTVRAWDILNGQQMWETSIFTDANGDLHRILLYSAWSHFTTLIPEGNGPAKLITATVTDTHALDRTTGEIVWTEPLGSMYGGAIMLRDPEDQLILATELGRLLSLDPHTGRDNWEIELGYRVFNSRPTQEDGILYAPGFNGQLTTVDQLTGTVLQRYQIGPTAQFATPALLGNTLVVAGIDGIVRGLDVGRRGR